MYIVQQQASIASQKSLIKNQCKLFYQSYRLLFNLLCLCLMPSEIPTNSLLRAYRGHDTKRLMQYFWVLLNIL